MITLTELFGEEASILRDRNFQLLLLANVFPGLGVALLSPVLDSLIEPLGASPATIGLMISVFSAPSIVAIPVAGVLADKYGRKPILSVSLVAFGVAGAAVGGTTHFQDALVLRTIQGVAFAGLTPILITSIGDIYVGTREATAQGLRFTGTGISQAVFPLISGVLVVAAWQFPFLLYALAVPIAGLVYVAYEEPPVRDEASEDRSYRRALFALVRRRRVIALVVARSLGPVVWIAFLTYNSLIVVRLIGGTPGEAGLLVALGSIVFAASSSQAGRTTALFGSRFYPLVVANVALVAGLGLVLFAPSLPVAGVGIVVVGCGFGLAISLYRSIITGLASDDLRAGLVSVSESGSRIVVTLTPVAIGALIATFEPIFGFERAVRLSGLGVATVSAGGGIFCLVIVRTSRELSIDRASEQ